MFCSIEQRITCFYTVQVNIAVASLQPIEWFTAPTILYAYINWLKLISFVGCLSTNQAFFDRMAVSWLIIFHWFFCVSIQWLLMHLMLSSLHVQCRMNEPLAVIWLINTTYCQCIPVLKYLSQKSHSNTTKFSVFHYASMQPIKHHISVVLLKLYVKLTSLLLSNLWYIRRQLITVQAQWRWMKSLFCNDTKISCCWSMRTFVIIVTWNSYFS